MKVQNVELSMGEPGASRRPVREQKETHRVSVAAEVYGHLAVHESQDSWGWHVTHIPTGRAVELELSERGARWLAERLLKLADWDFTDSLAPKRWSKSRRARIDGAVAKAKRMTDVRPQNKRREPA